jgi:hypothetical protein
MQDAEVRVTDNKILGFEVQKQKRKGIVIPVQSYGGIVT